MASRLLSVVYGCAFLGLRAGLFATSVMSLGLVHTGAAMGALASSAPVNSVAPRVQVNMKAFAASDEVRLVANWMMRGNVHRGHPFIIADKVGGLLFAFAANGELLARTPALFGAARSDTLTAEQADKTLDESLEADKVTPAGVFPAHAYRSPSYGKSVRFAGYAHTNLLIHSAPSESRLQRLRSAATSQKRVTYGCINALPEFVKEVLLPNFSGESTVVVLPETQSARTFFAINDAVVLATRSKSRGSR